MDNRLKNLNPGVTSHAVTDLGVTSHVVTDPGVTSHLPVRAGRAVSRRRRVFGTGCRPRESAGAGYRCRGGGGGGGGGVQLY